MKKLFTAAIGLLLILFYCSSCKTVKNVQKDKESTHTELDSAGKTKTKTNLTEKVVSSTVITEDADTITRLKGSVVTGETRLAALQSGQPFTVQDGNVSATVIEKDGKLTLTATEKDREVNLKFNKTTRTTATTDRKQETKASASVKKSEEKQEEKKTLSKHVERSGPGVFGWIIIVLLALVIAAELTKNYWKRFVP